MKIYSLLLKKKRQNKSEGEIFLLPNLVTLCRVYITKQRAHEELKEQEIETYGVWVKIIKSKESIKKSVL